MYRGSTRIILQQLKEIFDEEKNDHVVFKLNRVGVGTLLHPFIQQKDHFLVAVFFTIKFSYKDYSKVFEKDVCHST